MLAGNRSPHAVLALHLEPAGPTLELPAATTWRAAAAKLDGKHPPAHLAAR
jgi:hypothetical protein